MTKAEDGVIHGIFANTLFLDRSGDRIFFSSIFLFLVQDRKYREMGLDVFLGRRWVRVVVGNPDLFAKHRECNIPDNTIPSTITCPLPDRDGLSCAVGWWAFFDGNWSCFCFCFFAIRTQAVLLEGTGDLCGVGAAFGAVR